MKKITRSLLEISRPEIGEGGYPFTGSHGTFRVVRHRNGDEIIEQTFQGDPHRAPSCKIREDRWLVSETFANLCDILAEHNCELIDDIPQGFSVVQ
jgi:hypothetical protein